MPTIELPHATLNYHVAGPADSTAPPVVFVHPVLADGTLWAPVADRLAARGIRSYAPDWPLGSHRIPLPDDADQSPLGVARLITDFLEALDLTDVTLVGNDTGGALCQFVVDPASDVDASRVGRLVLANCDAFDAFPPFPFTLVFPLLRSEAGAKVIAGRMGNRLLRQSWLGYGLLAKNLPAELTRSWIEPCRTDAGVRRDTVRLLQNLDPADLLDVSTRLRDVKLHVTVIWGMADRAFRPSLGRRLHAAFTDAEFIPVKGARTLLALDAPDELTDAIVAIAGR
ncbi:alpha/beta hydrolase [Nocardioides humilatus]|uniref:Alpha/beta hydrolase n=1 Tax=Nocardioides humilatus TaxID=2607660 RepID=A0A5B1LM59_9ACTN|nr:alpha/beta hydrolase [Nocardioides humilatus]KAA1421178.1 alpha/beta hydrolase [Nocardioides humilatus]